MKLTIEERIARLEKHGYTMFHLFGNWYLGRVWSKNFRRFSPYWIYHITEF